MAELSTLIDEFATLNSTLWGANSYGSYSVTGGRARIVNDATFSAFATAKTWSMSVGVRLYIRAYPDLVAGSGATESYTAIRINRNTPAGTDVSITYNALTGNLDFENRVSYFDATKTSVAYNATNHAFWSFYRPDATTLFFQTAPETSPGVPSNTWSIQRSITLPSWMTSATNMQFMMEAHKDAGAAGVAEFDNLNSSTPIGGGGGGSSSVGASS